MSSMGAAAANHLIRWQSSGLYTPLVYDLKDSHLTPSLLAFQALSDSDLLSRLIADLFLDGLANGSISVEEQEKRSILSLDAGGRDEQIEAIQAVPVQPMADQEYAIDSGLLYRLIKESASTLLGAGVPIACYRARGSVFGLSAAGEITSGASRLAPCRPAPGMWLARFCLVPPLPQVHLGRETHL